MKAMDIALLMTFFTLLIFVGVVIICNINGIEIQDSLINMFLGIIGAEITACGGIKIFKVKHNRKENNLIVHDVTNHKDDE